MDLADSDEFTRRLVGLGELFEANLTPVKQALYFEALRDLPFDLVAHALNGAIKTHTFMPKPAELRKLVVGDDEAAAESAWMTVRKAMRLIGAYASVVIEDPALGDAVNAVFGTWPAACALELSPEMRVAQRKEFGRVYRVLRDRGLDGARYLPGICEQQNAGRAEWLHYVEVRRVSGTTIDTLSFDEAEQARSQIASTRQGLTLMKASATAAPRRIIE